MRHSKSVCHQAKWTNEEIASHPSLTQWNEQTRGYQAERWLEPQIYATNVPTKRTTQSHPNTLTPCRQLTPQSPWLWSTSRLIHAKIPFLNVQFILSLHLQESLGLWRIHLWCVIQRTNHPVDPPLILIVKTTSPWWLMASVTPPLIPLLCLILVLKIMMFLPLAYNEDSINEGRTPSSKRLFNQWFLCYSTMA